MAEVTDLHEAVAELVRDGDTGGADDPTIPPEHGEFIRDIILGAGFEVIPNAAHLANVEQPEEITRSVLDHVSLTTARRTAG